MAKCEPAMIHRSEPQWAATGHASCRIILVDDAVMKARGWTRELLL
jgi:hypothetical protein